MLCQVCLQAEATIHVLDRLSGDRPVEADYCQACYDIKYINPPARPPDFPRPRFTIKQLMILTGVFAAPNAAVMLIMRSGMILGTPAQIRDWTMEAFLAINFGFGLLVASILLLRWMAEVRSYKMTGGLVPMPEWKTPPPREFLGRLITRLAPMLAWLNAWALLMRWLKVRFWPNGGLNPRAFLLMNAILPCCPLMLWTFLTIRSNRALVERIRTVWGGASRGERAFTILLGLWPLVMMTLPSILGFRSIMGSNLWLASCVLLLIGLGGALLLFLGAVVLTRRR
jgi:hypothetical protein